MKRIQYHRYGVSGGSHLEAVERLPPGSGEMRLHVAAASSANPDTSERCTAEAKLFTGLQLPWKPARPGSITATRARRPRTATGRKAYLGDAFPALIEFEADHRPQGELTIVPAAGHS